MTAPTSPKPTTPADPNDLRTALTKLADEWESRVNQSRLWWDGAGEIRDLLAAHPAPAVSVEEAWRKGEAAGWGRAMRRMSDEPGVRRAKNPYRPTPEGDAR